MIPQNSQFSNLNKSPLAISIFCTKQTTWLNLTAKMITAWS